MSDLEKIQADMAFYAEVGPILEEFEAARESKKDDPERWQAAKQAVDGEDGVRTRYRAIAEYLAASSVTQDDDASNTNISVAPVAADSAALAPQGA